MNSVKVKNFIILVLLLVNAVLLSVFVTDYARERELAGAAVEGAAALLEENGISVSPDADLSYRSRAALTATRRLPSEAEKAAALLGDCSVSDEGGNILVYTGERGQAKFRGTGSFEILIYSAAFYGRDPLEQARSVAESLGLETAREPLSMELDEANGDGSIVLACTVDGAEVLNCRLSFTMVGGNVRMVMGTRVLDDIAEGGAEDGLDVPTVLMRFLSIVRERGHVCSELTGLELCYAMNANVAGEGELTPVWRIDTDTGSFYINAVTGLEEAMA